MSMEVTNDYKGGYWENLGYNSYNSFGGNYGQQLRNQISGAAPKAHDLLINSKGSLGGC
jgi:hypothetical protein